jgi:hypothetical protein
MNYLKWWLVLAACVLLNAVLVPLSIVFVAAAKPVLKLSDYAQLRLREIALRKGRTQ